MRLANLRRSTPFRLALTFGVLFVVSFAICGGIMYHMLRTGLATQIDINLSETNSVILSTYTSDNADDTNDMDDVIALLNSYAATQSTSDGLYSLSDGSGKHLAGNFTAPPMNAGIKTMAATTLGLAGGGRYRVQISKLGPYTLVVGESFSDTDSLLKVILVSLGWAATLVIAFALGGGIFLATRAQARLDAVASTMFEVSNGRLDARIPVLAANDDLDVVAGQINDALGRLSGLVEGMRQVSADIAHELRTPLNRLRMTLDDACARTERGEDIATDLAEARVEIDHINATFEALLRISQIEAGVRRDRFRQVDLREILQLVDETYASVAEDRGQYLVLETAETAIVQGDRELLIQMVVNLVENSITHCPAGTVIRCMLTTSDEFASVTVLDNGPGIPESEQENVFRRLYRLDKSRTTPGSGLGLSLVRAIAELHHAKVSVADCAPGLSVSIIIPT
jgi:signal transduction histidine kinase